MMQIRAKLVGGPRDGEERMLPTRDTSNPWTKIELESKHLTWRGIKHRVSTYLLQGKHKGGYWVYQFQSQCELSGKQATALLIGGPRDGEEMQVGLLRRNSLPVMELYLTGLQSGEDPVQRGYAYRLSSAFRNDGIYRYTFDRYIILSISEERDG